MEENNRKGPGVFYAVVGVATLVVAIIGATFAFFSASASVNGNENIAGGTQDISNALTADVTAVYTGADAAAGPGLVPTDITDAKDNVDAAVAKKCVSKGYTGCHLYQIHVKSTTTLDAVELNLASMAFDGTAPQNTADWKWMIYQAADDAKSNGSTYTMFGDKSLVASTNFVTTDASIRTAGMQAGTDYYYYLMVYVANTDLSQNEGTNSVLAKYKGTISFAAGSGGKVTASFMSA